MAASASVNGSNPQALYVMMNTSQIAWFPRLIFQDSRRFRRVIQTRGGGVASEREEAGDGEGSPQLWPG